MRNLLAVFATLLVSLCVACPGCNSPAAADAQRTAVEIDARKTLAYLASDEMEGRGPGTAGLDRAADYIAQQFQTIGLRALPGQRDYFQPFEMTTATELGPQTALRVADRKFEPREEFVPLNMSAEGVFDAPVVFAGYGTKSPDHKYDDYAGVDAKGKVVLALRYEPHDENGKSRFAEQGWSEAATFATKVRHAKEAGAVALLIVSPSDFAKDDRLIPFAGPRGQGETGALPVLHVKQAVAEEILRRGGAAELATLQNKIDEATKPASTGLDGVTVAGNVDIVQKQLTVKNVVGYLPGKNADEYVVVGAHYDHLGRGGMGSLRRRGTTTQSTPQIHNGADDNASGTTALIAMAAEIASRGTPPRSIIFAAFTAEEEGLLGSRHFVEHPPVPLEDIAAMLNLDMVGRVRTVAEHAASSTTKQTTTAEATTQDSAAGVLYVGGMGTARNFDAIVKKADARSPLVIRDIGRGGIGPSDHMSFALKKIPVLFLFSGLHGDYHRPSDDPEKINYDGLAEVIDFAGDIVGQIAASPRQSYVQASDASPMRVGGTGQRSRVSLGVMPDYSSFGQGGGVKVSDVMPNSPAAAAGIKANDVIVRIDEKQIDTLYDLSDVLAKGKPGQKVKVHVVRGVGTATTQPVQIDATLAERKD
jgi:Zn-dependent M28 family amino/carboxypeptidase